MWLRLFGTSQLPVQRLIKAACVTRCSRLGQLVEIVQLAVNLNMFVHSFTPPLPQGIDLGKTRGLSCSFDFCLRINTPAQFLEILKRFSLNDALFFGQAYSALSLVTFFCNLVHGLFLGLRFHSWQACLGNWHLALDIISGYVDLWLNLEAIFHCTNCGVLVFVAVQLDRACLLEIPSMILLVACGCKSMRFWRARL